MTTAPVGCLDGEQAIRDALVRKPTPGPWKIVTREHKHHLGGTHIEANIFCAWDHPQLKGPLPVVGTSTGIGPTDGSKPIQFTYIAPADAALIAACDPETMRALLAELDRLRSASRQEGWQLVPVEPTPKMIGAAQCYGRDDRGNIDPAFAYHHMLAAAPQQSQEAQGDRHG